MNHCFVYISYGSLKYNWVRRFTTNQNSFSVLRKRLIQRKNIGSRLDGRWHTTGRFINDVRAPRTPFCFVKLRTVHSTLQLDKTTVDARCVMSHCKMSRFLSELSWKYQFMVWPLYLIFHLGVFWSIQRRRNTVDSFLRLKPLDTKWYQLINKHTSCKHEFLENYKLDLK